VVVCGRQGRMSTLIAGLVAETPGMTLRARLSAHGSQPSRGSAVEIVESLRCLEDPPSVVVDFTAREQTAAVLADAALVPCGLVIGTSGLTSRDRRLMAEVASRRAVVTAANFSLGVSLLGRFVSELARRPDDGWSAGVLDVHFAGKQDRPSATATFLAEKWRQGRDGEVTAEVCSFRMGDGVSEHVLLSSRPGERLDVRHQVLDRKAFLPGVLAAIRFAERAAPGLYSLEDVLTSGTPRDRK
jgi:4-hydroxy-tetrahydrodipicolinate reductase